MCLKSKKAVWRRKICVYLQIYLLSYPKSAIPLPNTNNTLIINNIILIYYDYHDASLSWSWHLSASFQCTPWIHIYACHVCLCVCSALWLHYQLTYDCTWKAGYKVLFFANLLINWQTDSCIERQRDTQTFRGTDVLLELAKANHRWHVYHGGQMNTYTDTLFFSAYFRFKTNLVG